MPEVIIDGIKYVPAKSVVVDADKFINALLEQFWGVVTDDNLKDSMDLRIIVTDDERFNIGITLEELINKIAESN